MILEASGKSLKSKATVKNVCWSSREKTTIEINFKFCEAYDTENIPKCYSSIWMHPETKFYTVENILNFIWRSINDRCRRCLHFSCSIIIRWSQIFVMIRIFLYYALPFRGFLWTDSWRHSACHDQDLFMQRITIQQLNALT